jgi:hypothetical protein
MLESERVSEWRVVDAGGVGGMGGCDAPVDGLVAGIVGRACHDGISKSSVGICFTNKFLPGSFYSDTDLAGQGDGFGCWVRVRVSDVGCRVSGEVRVRAKVTVRVGLALGLGYG